MGILAYKQYQRFITPKLVQVNGIQYVLTEGETDDNAIDKKLGVINKVVDRYSYLNNDFESNFLPIGSSLYSSKEEPGEQIIYQYDGRLYEANQLQQKNK
ncbi:hypothetical protein KKC_09297 [Listeria fleischmannii subsp. coloradonensis]|nr:hypothetical protein KKC_09297 [Listeria fleischmannii subsp. coloradonensis]